MFWKQGLLYRLSPIKWPFQRFAGLYPRTDWLGWLTTICYSNLHVNRRVINAWDCNTEFMTKHIQQNKQPRREGSTTALLPPFLTAHHGSTRWLLFHLRFWLSSNIIISHMKNEHLRWNLSFRSFPSCKKKFVFIFQWGSQKWVETCCRGNTQLVELDQGANSH